uniref:Uncharacterized protein n=1 Tax=Micrurus spixii TaxID=129469 RepID=A0A2D4M529_9SAUR
METYLDSPTSLEQEVEARGSKEKHPELKRRSQYCFKAEKYSRKPSHQILMMQFMPYLKIRSNGRHIFARNWPCLVACLTPTCSMHRKIPGAESLFPPTPQLWKLNAVSKREKYFSQMA